MESLKAGIRSSCRLDQEAVLDGSSPRGEDAIIMPTMVPAAFTAEGWPLSCRKGGRLQIGMPAGLRSEYWPLWRRKPWPLSVGICTKIAPTLRNLDVDWMVVPSCGDGKTMSDHIAAAAEIQTKYDGRTFVVQQVWPNREDGGLGYVLPAPMTLRDLNDEKLLVSQSFSTYVVVPPSRS